ncbi:MAG TPA: LppA family lipoprotein [Pseudonocardiaceae bacterium]|nr:LppA family lipoprotein [Pseudonocardiaceae bacterium]
MPGDQRRGGHGSAVGIGVFAALGTVVSAFLLLPLAMSSDGCASDDLRFRCSATGQFLLPCLPWFGLALGLAIAVIGWWQRDRWADGPAIGLGTGAIVFLVTAVLAVSMADEGAVAPGPQQVAGEFSQLDQRPDLRTMVARYQHLVATVQQQLSSVAPTLRWQPATEPVGESCGPPFAAVGDQGSGDAEYETIEAGTSAQDEFTVQQWVRVVNAMTTLLRDNGFSVVHGSRVDQQGGYRVEFQDAYGATLDLGSVTGTGIELTTGCFLTAAAKQRGHPAPPP